MKPIAVPAKRRSTVRATRMCATLAAVLAASAFVARADADETVSFAAQVQPIFRAKCERCHGAEVQKSALNLGSPQGIAKGGESGPILDGEKPKEGTLYQYVHDRLMPPEGEGELTDDEIATIGRWIEAGAKL